MVFINIFLLLKLIFTFYRIDKDFHAFHFEISVPAIQFRSTYRVSGRILNFQLDGKGSSAFNFSELCDVFYVTCLYDKCLYDVLSFR